jgi:putative ABC transport system permease protein
MYPKTIEALIQDVRYGLRLIRKAPGFSAVAIVSLAIGIGASTVLFSFANVFLFRPVHAANPEQLIQVFTGASDGDFNGGSSYADYEDMRALPVFDDLLAATSAQATLSDRQWPVMLNGLLVSGNYFDVLGLQPSRGRFFRTEENRTPGTHPVVVLSHDAWRRRFGADPAIAGRAIELNGHPFTVIGVGPPRFAGTTIEQTADFFVPAMMQRAIAPDADLLRDRRIRPYRIFGRLKAGVARREADAALGVLAAQLVQQDPVAWRDDNGRGRAITALPELEARFAGAGPGTILAAFSGVILGALALLAVACVNVATVLLAQASTRRKEIAVRLAMGAPRRRVIRQLLTECGLLAIAGGVLGLLIAQAVAALFLRFRPDAAPALDLTLDYRILLFSIGASLLTVAFFGLLPALQTTRPDVNADLKDTVRSIRVRGWRFGFRSGLVVTQVALSLALLVGAALMLRSAGAGYSADPGFRRADVINVAIDLSTVAGGPDARARFYSEAVRSAAALPGVERAALAALVPMEGSNTQIAVRIADGGPPITATPDTNVVGPGYFSLLDIPVLRGREFTAADRATSPPVALVNEMMAREFWNGDAIGKVLTDDRTGEPMLIVGVVGDLRHRSFAEEPRPMVYLAAEQRSRPRMMLHVRTTAPLGAISPALQKSLQQIDRAAALLPPETMAGYFERVTQPQRLGAGAAMATGMLELALAVMALYGVIAFAAAQRRPEIGLRMALGATKSSVIALIMREGLVLTAVGMVAGVGLSLAGGAAIQSLLIGIGPADPLSFAGAALTLLLVCTAASYIPARRASSVDPSAALRSE